MTRYELLDRIGVGGMAEIFRGKAVAAGGFEKPVAIKRILPHLSQDKRFVELLIAEAKVLSLLKHRNIVQIFDVGLGDDGQYFLVMEYVDGKDLGGIQRALEARGKKRVPLDLALHVGAEICEALEHAHSARAPDGKAMNLVHRDVSPSNVMLSRAGEIKLTDFGIAKRAEGEQTGHGAVRGKFAYISPEQARNEHLEPRSDVFSVGILLWELIANRRLFSTLGDLEALRAVREASVPRLAETDPRIGKDLDALVMSALAKDVRKRPTAGQLGAALRGARYGMEMTVGDPAAELAKIVEATDEPVKPSAPKIEVEAEATVIHVRTADVFQARGGDAAAMSRARAVIERFEDEETRQAQLSSDQMQFLRGRLQQETSAVALPPPRLPGVAPMRDGPTEDEATRAVEPFDVLPESGGFSIAPTDGFARAPDSGAYGYDQRIPDSGGFEPPLQLSPTGPQPLAKNPFGDEATRLVAPRSRTPKPELAPEHLEPTGSHATNVLAPEHLEPTGSHPTDAVGAPEHLDPSVILTPEELPRRPPPEYLPPDPIDVRGPISRGRTPRPRPIGPLVEDRGPGTVHGRPRPPTAQPAPRRPGGTPGAERRARGKSEPPPVARTRPEANTHFTAPVPPEANTHFPASGPVAPVAPIGHEPYSASRSQSYSEPPPQAPPPAMPSPVPAAVAIPSPVPGAVPGLPPGFPANVPPHLAAQMVRLMPQLAQQLGVAPPPQPHPPTDQVPPLPPAGAYPVPVPPPQAGYPTWGAAPLPPQREIPSESGQLIAPAPHHPYPLAPRPYEPAPRPYEPAPRTGTRLHRSALQPWMLVAGAIAMAATAFALTRACIGKKADPPADPVEQH
ncbi:MAG TPA: protein kinase [Kofleriaceae bacterium]